MGICIKGDIHGTIWNMYYYSSSFRCARSISPCYYRADCGRYNLFRHSYVAFGFGYWGVNVCSFLIKALFRSIKNKLQNSSASDDGVVLDEETQQKFFADIDTMKNNHMKKFYIYTALSPFAICLFFFVFNEISINISKECLAKDIVARADAYNYKWDDEREYNRSLHEAADFYREMTGRGLRVTSSGEVYSFEDNDWHSIKDFFYQLSYTKYTIYDKIKNYKRNFD